MEEAIPRMIHKVIRPYYFIAKAIGFWTVLFGTEFFEIVPTVSEIMYELIVKFWDALMLVQEAIWNATIYIKM